MTERLVGRPRRSQGPVPQAELADPPPAPCSGSWMPTVQPLWAVPASREPRASTLLWPPCRRKSPTPAAKKLLGCPVQGITFADASQVQFHARLEQADRAGLGIELDELSADVSPGFGQLLGRRHAALAAGESPGPPERPSR